MARLPAGLNPCTRNENLHLSSSAGLLGKATDVTQHSCLFAAVSCDQHSFVAYLDSSRVCTAYLS